MNPDRPRQTITDCSKCDQLAALQAQLASALAENEKWKAISESNCNKLLVAATENAQLRTQNEELQAELDLMYEIMRSPMSDYSERPQDEGIRVAMLKDICHSTRLKNAEIDQLRTRCEMLEKGFDDLYINKRIEELERDLEEADRTVSYCGTPAEYHEAYTAGLAKGRKEAYEDAVEIVYNVVDSIGWGWDGDYNVSARIERAIKAKLGGE
jgi:hypothetical protein